MDKLKLLEFLKAHQQKIALILGFIAVAIIGFYGGLNLNQKSDQNMPTTAASSNSNYSENQAPVQTETKEQPAESLAPPPSVPSDCNGKIKGSSSYKYHLPSGAFYDRTTHPIACFDTETEAQKAGFVKSSR